MGSRSTSENSYRNAKRSLWDEDMPRERRDQILQEWIVKSEGDISWDVFVPKIENCGMWYSSPNKERHASFGDGGTTASTTCYGDLIQMSRFLGAGQSGVFSIDQSSMSEP